MTSETTHPDLFAHSDPRIFSTSPDEPEAGRTFIYADARWYERLDDADTGAVEFSPVSDSEPYLREWLAESGAEIDELDVTVDFAHEVREQFLNQLPLYPEAAEDSDQPVDMDQTLTAAELGTLSSSEDNRPGRLSVISHVDEEEAPSELGDFSET